jgi:hypothetical protein
MGQHHRALLPLLGLFCTSQLSTRWATAEDASAAEIAAARTLAVDGLKLAQSGNCTEAVPKLERAEKLYHAPVVASRLGECYVSVGRLVEGTEILRKVLREPQPAEPTPALTKALERAQKALDAAKPRIAGLTVKVAAVSELLVKVDGNAVASAMLDTEIPSDPGEHTVEASAPGFLKSSTRITVAEGERKTVTLTLTRDPNAPAVAVASPVASRPSATRPSSAATPPPETPAGSAAHDSARAPNRTAAYLALGFGAAGIGVGSVLGVMTVKQHDDLQSSCPRDTCPQEQQEDLEAAKRLGNFSTIAFGVGAAGLALGTVLYLTAGPSSVDQGRTVQKPRKLVGFSNPRATLGPTQIQLGADF